MINPKLPAKMAFTGLDDDFFIGLATAFLLSITGPELVFGIDPLGPGESVFDVSDRLASEAVTGDTELAAGKVPVPAKESNVLGANVGSAWLVIPGSGGAGVTGGWITGGGKQALKL